MLKANFVDVIYTHTEGEPTCIIHSGIPYPPGTDILEKRAFIQENYDWLRQALLHEPRGHKDMYGVFLTPPSSADYDAGIIWTDGVIYHDMCGHGTIALGMAMVANRFVPATGALTTIRFETTAGLVTAEVGSSAHSVDWTRFENVPAYVAEQDVSIELPEVGEVKADIVFGGNYFGIIKWNSAVKRIGPETGSYFCRLGVLAKKLIDEKISIRHPTKQHISNIDLVTFYHEPTRPEALYRNVHVLSSGAADRSPGGTGTSAMMAMFEARGEIKIGQPIQSEGLLGSGTFEGCLIGETKLGNYRAVIPTVKGKANIIGYAKWLIDPDDPVGRGFIIS
jgi:proline racemase